MCAFVFLMPTKCLRVCSQAVQLRHTAEVAVVLTPKQLPCRAPLVKPIAEVTTEWNPLPKFASNYIYISFFI